MAMLKRCAIQPREKLMASCRIGGENGDGGLGAAHEVARHDGHERGLSGDAAECAEKSEDALENCRTEQKADEWNGDVADGESSHGGDIKGEADAFG